MSKKNKNNKIFVRIFAAILAALMVLGASVSFLYMIFSK